MNKWENAKTLNKTEYEVRETTRTDSDKGEPISGDLYATSTLQGTLDFLVSEDKKSPNKKDLRAGKKVKNVNTGIFRHYP